MVSDHEILRKANEALLKANEALIKANEALNRANEALVKANDVQLRGNQLLLRATQTNGPATHPATTDLAITSRVKRRDRESEFDFVAMEALILYNAELLFAKLHKGQTPALHLEVYGQKPIIRACVENRQSGIRLIFVKGEVVNGFEEAMESLLYATRRLLMKNIPA